MYANIFCDAGQVPILRYFEAWEWEYFLGFASISNIFWVPDIPNFLWGKQ